MFEGTEREREREHDKLHSFEKGLNKEKGPLMIQPTESDGQERRDKRAFSWVPKKQSH